MNMENLTEVETGKFVVVTTGKQDRGVFGGILLGGSMTPGILELADARNCIKWSESTRGVFGLAAIGPQSGSRIGPKIPSISLAHVNSISVCTPIAQKQWEAEPWT
jgi:hypothetical protein